MARAALVINLLVMILWELDGQTSPGDVVGSLSTRTVRISSLEFSNRSTLFDRGDSVLLDICVTGIEFYGELVGCLTVVPLLAKPTGPMQVLGLPFTCMIPC